MRLIKKYLKTENGMTLVEVLVASVIFSFTILAFGYIFALGEGLVGHQGERRTALTLAREAIERIQGQPPAGTSVFTWLRNSVNVQNVAPYYWSLSNNVWSNGALNENLSNTYNRNINVSFVQDNALDTVVATSSTLRITVIVSHPQGEYQPVTLTKIFTNTL